MACASHLFPDTVSGRADGHRQVYVTPYSRAPMFYAPLLQPAHPSGVSQGAMYVRSSTSSFLVVEGDQSCLVGRGRHV